MNKRYRSSAILGIALAATFYVLSLLFDLDVCEALGRGVASMEPFEVDELLLAGVVFAFVEYRNHSRRKRMRVYEATAGAAQHVLGNLLQGLQMRKEAVRGDVPPDVVAFWERLTTEAGSQLKALSSVQRIDERSIWQAVAPESRSRNREE